MEQLNRGETPKKEKFNFKEKKENTKLVKKKSLISKKKKRIQCILFLK